MTFRGKIQTALATAAIGVAPLALASGATAHPATPHMTPSQAKAYGKYCAAAGASKKHVAGQKGTPFADCVTAMSRAANSKPAPTTAASQKVTAEKFCKAAGESQKGQAGQKHTPYSQCVSATTKFLAALRHS